jgi:hypothetical protein
MSGMLMNMASSFAKNKLANIDPNQLQDMANKALGSSQLQNMANKALDPSQIQNMANKALDPSQIQNVSATMPPPPQMALTLSEEDKLKLKDTIENDIVDNIQEEKNNEDNEHPLTIAVTDRVVNKLLLDDAFINALSVKIKQMPVGGAKKTKTRRKTRRKRNKTKTKRRK